MFDPLMQQKLGEAIHADNLRQAARDRRGREGAVTTAGPRHREQPWTQVCVAWRRALTHAWSGRRG